jgi:hypothetical protein
MPNNLVQVGVGGIFILLFLQLILPWLLKVVAAKSGKQQAAKSGELDPSYWEKMILEITEGVVQRAMIQLLKPSLDAQTDVLRDIRGSLVNIRDNTLKLVNAQESAERRGGQ